MPPKQRKRPAPVDEDDVPTPTQRRPTQRDYPDEDDQVDDVEEEHVSGSGSGSIAQLSKNLVRYAVSCEYSRTTIKRQDIAQKVLGTHSRSFRPVFDAANAQLMDVFGMRMVELPNREKVTLRQKRAAAGTESQVKNSNVWVLTSILPQQYRALDCMAPAIDSDDEDAVDTEGAYMGLYTMVISLISLSGGQLSEGKLDRFLNRMNAGDSTPAGPTDKVMARMAKDGYVVKIKDTSSGEEIVDYMVGPRGKVEVGKEAVANFVRTVYGNDVEDLDQRLKRSLGLAEEDEGDGGAVNEPAAAAGSVERRPGRPRRQQEEEDE